MSKITTIFDKLVSDTGTILSTYRHLPDGIDIEKNANTALIKGYAIAMGPASPGPEQYGCAVQLFERQFTIAITNMYNMRTDATSRDVAEKAIMEDLYLVTKALIKNPSLGGISSNVQFVADSGTEYLNQDTQEFLYADLTINVWYEEAL